MKQRRDYIRANAETTAGEFDSSVYVGGQPPQAVFLRPLHGNPFFGRVVREGASPAGANYRSVNPHVRALPFDSGKRDFQSLSWSIVMPKPAAPGASSALVIPFPRYRRPANRRAQANFGTPDFDAGFEFAMMFVRNLKASGQLSHLKGA